MQRKFFFFKSHRKINFCCRKKTGKRPEPSETRFSEVSSGGGRENFEKCRSGRVDAHTGIFLCDVLRSAIKRHSCITNGDCFRLLCLQVQLSYVLYFRSSSCKSPPRPLLPLPSSLYSPPPFPEFCGGLLLTSIPTRRGVHTNTKRSSGGRNQLFRVKD